MKALKKVIKDIGLRLTTIFIIIFTLSFSSLILSFPIKWLWNYVIPPIFNLPKITYYQSLALFILSGLLIKNTLTVNKKED
jgi:hypothetical protein